MRSRSCLPEGASCEPARIRVPRTVGAGFELAPCAADARGAAPTAQGASTGFHLYVLVTRKGSLTHETVEGRRR